HPGLVPKYTRVRSSGAEHESEEIYRRTDYCGVTRGRGWCQGKGSMPKARDIGADVLQLEGEVRRHDRFRCAPTEGSGIREQQAQTITGRSGTRQSSTEGSSGPKMVSPQAKREGVRIFVSEHDFGVTRACGLVQISRSLFRYCRRRTDRPGLLERIEEIAALKRRYGYRRGEFCVTPHG